jgi:hypothetical protein
VDVVAQRPAPLFLDPVEEIAVEAADALPEGWAVYRQVAMRRGPSSLKSDGA